MLENAMYNHPSFRVERDFRRAVKPDLLLYINAVKMAQLRILTIPAVTSDAPSLFNLNTKM